MPKPNVREKIVVAGLEQFHQRGFNGSSVDDITRAAEVPKGSFYNHFKSKELLALEVMERYRAAGMHKSLVEGRSPVKRLKEYFAHLAKVFIDSGYNRGCLFGNLANEMADHSPEIQARLKVIFKDWSGALAAIIKEGQASGEISSAMKPEQLAGFLLSAWEGTLVRARSAKDSSCIDDFNKVAFNLLQA